MSLVAAFDTISIEEATERLIDYRGKTPPKTDSGIRLITAKVIKDGRILEEPKEFIAAAFYDQWMRRGLPHELDVLVTTEAPLGEVAILRDEAKVALAQRVILLRARQGKVDPLYLYYAIQSEFGQGELRARASGTTVSGIKQSELRQVRIPIFPPVVQRRVADILSAYDDLIENSLRRIRVLEEMARVLYREWFVHFRFPGHENVTRVASSLGHIPQGWEAVPLCALIDFAKGRKPAETRGEPLPGDVPLLLIDALRGGETVYAQPTNLVIAEPRDTIMVMDGASSCEVTLGFAGAVGSTLGRFRSATPDVLSPHALYWFLNTKAEEFKSKNIGAAIPHANRDYILTQRIALPTPDVTERFQAYLEPLQREVEILRAQTRNLRRTRDLLLPRLLSGRLPLTGSAA